jgi:hypothetical protein
MLKKAPYQPDDEQLKAGREIALNRIDRDLYADVGFFVCNFSLAETTITNILALATGHRDFTTFEILCRGMDARVKLRALRDASKLHRGIGPNLTTRLALFEKGAVPLRNRLLHSSLTHSEGEGDLTYYLSSAAASPWRELKFAPSVRRAAPEHVRSLDLYAWGVWLHFFAMDLSLVQPLARAGEELEIANPKSRLQPEARPAKPKKAPRTKPDKRDQTPGE